MSVPIIFRRIESRPSFRALVFFLLLFLRSHARLLHPQVWVEDAATTYGGTNILDFVRYGVSAFTHPVNGYLIVLPKLISGASLLISFTYYPAISTVLAWLAIVLILMAVASQKTQLRGGVLLGCIALMVPADPEVFGLPVYTFWWATLLLFAVILWKPNSSDLKWRLPLLFLGGLSSPVVVGLMPVFLLRSAIYRKVWQEWAVSASAVFCALAQFRTYRNCGIKFPPPLPVKARLLAHIVPIFLGRYLIGNLAPSKLALWLAGFALLALAIIVLFRRWRRFAYAALAGLLAVVIAVTMYRVDIFILHPVRSGPRYFFLPFVLISWFLAQIVFDENRRYLKITAGAFLVLSLANAVPALTRQQDDLLWRDHVASCPFFNYYSIPVEFNGQVDRAWEMRITGTQCEILLKHDLLRRLRPQPATFPYLALPYGPGVSTAALAALSTLGKQAGTNLDPHPEGLNGLVVLRTSTGSPSGAPPRITLQLHKGQTVLYRSSSAKLSHKLLIDDGRLPFLQLLPPRTGWTMLFFSSSLLPDDFSATFMNESGPQGAWLEIGVYPDDAPQRPVTSVHSHCHLVGR